MIVSFKFKGQGQSVAALQRRIEEMETRNNETNARVMSKLFYCYVLPWFFQMFYF